MKCSRCSGRLPDEKGSKSNLASPLGADLNPPYLHTLLVFFDTLGYIMVLLDEKPPKWETAPPPYILQNSTVPTTSLNAAAAPPPFSRPRTRITFISLPQHILLEVIQTSVAPDLTSWTEHRLALWWLATELRLVCRGIYTGALVRSQAFPPQPTCPQYVCTSFDRLIFQTTPRVSSPTTPPTRSRYLHLHRLTQPSPCTPSSGKRQSSISLYS